jgi:hypothetical protein
MIWSRNRPDKRWCPAPGFWPKVCAELPDGADRSRFKASIKEAFAIYRDEERRAAKNPPWAKMIRHFDKVLKETRRFNSSHRVRPYVLNDVLRARCHAAFQLRLENELADKRRERLYANLIVACTEIGGLNLSDSVRGPLNRVLQGILDQKGLSAGGVRRVVQRHIKRDGAKVALG